MGSPQSINRQAIEIISSQIVNLFIQQTISCQTQLDLDQSITMTSRPYQGPGQLPGQDIVVPISAAVESGPGCVACLQAVQLYQSTVLDNYVKLKGHGNSRPFPTTEQYLKSLFNNIQAQCAAPCKSMTVTNVSQTLNLALNVSCVSSTQQNLDFYSNLNVNLFQSMVNEKDFLAGLVTAFQALIPGTGQTVQEQITRLLNEVRTTLQSSSAADMGQMMLVTQNMRIEGNTGVLVNRVSQNAMKTYMIENVYGALQGIKIVTDANYQVVQDLLDKQASLKDIFASGARLATTWIDALSTSAQAFLLVAIGVTAVVFAIWLIVAGRALGAATDALDKAKRVGCDVAFKRALPEGATPLKPSVEAAAVPTPSPIAPSPIVIKQPTGGLQLQ
jgi:hypothetical protein